MLIYVSHPFSNKKENLDDIERIIKELVKEHPEHIYISPCHTFSFLYDFVETYEQGLDMCLELLSKCEKMLVYGDWKSSRGCKAEVLYCEMNMIPYEIVEG